MFGISGPLTLAIGLLVAGCGTVEGIAPPPGDLSGITRPASPNTALAGPPDFTPTPDLPTRRYNITSEKLFAIVRDVIGAQPRTTMLATDASRLRADHVARSRVFGFPDVVLVQVLGTPDGQSDLVLYSYSLKGHYDFGVNRKRVVATLAALDVALESALGRPGLSLR